MKTFFAKEPALAAKQQDEIVFTQEVATKGKPVYRYHLLPFDQLLFMFIKGKYAYHFHEYIFENAPVKLYLDYEKKGLTKDEQHMECEKELQDIIRRINLCLSKLMPEEPVYTILEAKDPTKNKFSVHVVYHNVWCQNMNAVSQFIRKLDLADVLDVSIYSAEYGKTFRYPYAEKIGSCGRRMIPRGQLPSINSKKFCECLVSTTKKHSAGKYKHLLSPDAPDTFLLTVDEDYVVPSSSSSSNKRQQLLRPLTEGELYVKEVLEKVKEWLRDFRDDVKFRWEQFDDKKATLYIENGLFCDHANRVHKSNNMLMKIFVVGRHAVKTSLFCFDEECCKLKGQQWNVDLSTYCCSNFKLI